ncbi:MULTISPECIES: hypothetical protein [Pseudomonas]|uniref:hypothetical protein n=1 Tax=Pseudomonas TaxID=286 RepID=UPI002271A55C|nr:hypothetical protein [Pseudomonas putida]WAB98834.1 hypothetical protein OSW16_04020 [Pseudomonas putida]
MTVTASIFMSLAIMTYIAHRKIDYIEGFLLNCKAVHGEKKIWLHAGLFGKLLRLSNVSFILLIPKIYARKNLVDIKEVNSLPSKIKKPLIILGAANLILTIAFFGLGIFMHYLPPLPQ